MNSPDRSEVLRQRADYTYRFNTKTGRHGWLRLTPAYSLKIVEELIVDHPTSRRIFDPFCGTGTTALTAAYYGAEAITTDINPFLIWLARAKSAHYSGDNISETRSACEEALKHVSSRTVSAFPAPPIHNIDRWWAPNALEFLQLLRGAIDLVTVEQSKARTLLLVAFCRTLIESSNAAFNHQSMSFKDDAQLEMPLTYDFFELFRSEVRFVLEGAAYNPPGKATVLYGDSRNPSLAVTDTVDLVITSPPYVNRMSYIRELRPYMYWLGFLSSGRDAGELDWTAIGGTWGIATSRLSDWERPSGHFESDLLRRSVELIAHTDNKNGVVLAKYVAKYFDDMWEHFTGLVPILAPGAELHYIVGNSTFYGSLVSTEVLYAEMLSALGFTNVECRPIRKRNSKKELVEFDVTATWR